MKTPKQVAFSIAMTSAMALTGIGTSVIPTFAAGSASITVNNVVKGAKYKIYKLFDGSFKSDDSNKMGDAVVNPAYKSIILSTIQKYDSSFALSGSDDNQALQLADKISKLNDKNPKFANDLAQAIKDAAPTDTLTSTDSSITKTGLDDGYYLIMSDPTDATYSSNGNAMTTAILQPIHGSQGKTINAKSSVPTVKKTVKDNTSTAWDKDFNHTADAGLLDSKIDNYTYKLQGTVASNIADYDKYQYIFTDTLPKGLSVTKDELDKDWNVSIKATSDKVTTGKDVSSAFTSSVTEATTDKGSAISWKSSDILPALKAAGITGDDLASAKITVEYTPVYDSTDINNMFGSVSKLSEPDINTVDLTFSNNPYEGGSGSTSKTPTDLNKVYDYNLIIKKVDSDAKALTGAKFTLTDANGKTVGKEIGEDQNGVFTFTGLDADTEYTITETKRPNGYKRIDPIKFKITSTPDDEKASITKISANETSDPSNAATLQIDDATVDATISNIEGPDMPLTGRQGIMLGLVVGGLIVSGSMIVLKNQKKE